MVGEPLHERVLETGRPSRLSNLAKDVARALVVRKEHQKRRDSFLTPSNPVSINSWGTLMERTRFSPNMIQTPAQHFLLNEGVKMRPASFVRTLLLGVVALALT